MDKKTAIGVCLVLLFLLATQEMGVVVVDARVCQSQSHKYKGTCWRDHNCALVCKHEGFPGGKCRGFQRRCFCTRNC